MTSRKALGDLRFNVSMSQDIDYKEANNECDIIEKDLDKLSKLEDVEEELGIDLITLFNIYNQLCKQRYVFKKFSDTGEVVKVDLDEGYFVVDFKGKQIVWIDRGEPSNWYEFKDYKKTLAFTREELDK